MRWAFCVFFRCVRELKSVKEKTCFAVIVRMYIRDKMRELD